MADAVYINKQQTQYLHSCVTREACLYSDVTTTSCLQISVPCDCSILWMSKTMSECPGTVSFNLDQLPCGAADWTDVPATIAVNHDCRAGDCDPPPPPTPPPEI